MQPKSVGSVGIIRVQPECQPCTVDECTVNDRGAQERRMRRVGDIRG